VSPVLIDAYCGVGGATRGYQRAGFYVVGIDNRPQRDYGGNEFILGDVRDVLPGLLADADVVHASPPCQHYSTPTKGTNRNSGREHSDLIPRTREILAAHPMTILENVQSAPIRRDLLLCGAMFGLSVLRHRNFELSFPIPQPRHDPHVGRISGWRHGEEFTGPYVAVYGQGGGKGSVPEWQTAMEIDWTDSRRSIAEAIPPMYSLYIGSHVLAGVTA